MKLNCDDVSKVLIVVSDEENWMIFAIFHQNNQWDEFARECQDSCALRRELAVGSEIVHLFYICVSPV